VTSTISGRRAVGPFRHCLIILIGATALALPGAAAASGASKGANAPRAAKAASPVRAAPQPKRPTTASRAAPTRQAAAQPKRKNPRVVAAAAATQPALPQRVSIGQAIGLHLVDDPLDLKSSVALVIDQASGDALFQKNPKAVLPIASITKVMTALVVLDARQSLDEVLTVTEADRDTERHSGSRLHIGAQLTRREMLQLALMASENRAASALGRNYPGGLAAFVVAMNAKARELGMEDTRFADATGLSGSNVSNARDLATMVRHAYEYPEVREFSTSAGASVETGPRRMVAFRSTNRLIDSPDWDIGLQKTGYISEAGRCLVMQARIDGRRVIIVLLDSAGTHYRAADAQRIRTWLRSQPRNTTAETDIVPEELDQQS
jgi:serine-type D-Ala-D-Ala endopeptidase (penicillin-binding protein 7)